MAMSKRARRRASGNYSHSEALYRHERDDKDKIISSEIVGYADIRGDGRTMSAHTTKPYVVRIPRPARRNTEPTETEES